MSFLNKLKQRKQEVENKIYTVATTVVDTVKEHVIQPVIQLDESAVERRLEICRSCDYYIKDSSRCSLCGCFMNFKTRLTQSSCPIGKW
jgi:hypothetical protein